MWNDLTIGYLAGLIDGEGHISISGPNPRVVVVSTDLDILERAQGLSGIGSIRNPIPTTGKTRYQWHVDKQDEVLILLETISPWLCKRRINTQVIPALDILAKRMAPRICEECGNCIKQSTRKCAPKYCPGECRRLAFNRRQRSYYHKKREENGALPRDRTLPGL